MRLPIKLARPLSLNDSTRHAVELEALNRAERAKSDGYVATVSTDDDTSTKQIDQLQKMVDMLEKRFDLFMSAAETPQTRYGPGSKNMEQRCYTCGSTFHLRWQCPDNRRGPRDKERMTAY
ncbi:hypothetical protein DPMN_194324 [Dreissena polymorpha]|uniref:CCHC-type domain-containing protein n=1 Tax=Dreissena polymorpha TaxID=45954 RepID=A0A9D3Y3Q5_DREPO|nr:hypothetical protein DPMN_194324 [Dreissena polymorpha]